MKDDKRVYESYRTTATIYIAVGILFIGISLTCAAFGQAIVAIIFGIVALAIGKVGFDHFEKSVEHEPEEPPDQFVHELIVFPVQFKSGEEVKLGLEIQYDSVTDDRMPLDRIEVHLQRTLNNYFLSLTQLSDDPYLEIDRLLLNEIPLLERKLGIRGLDIQTVEVKQPHRPAPPKPPTPPAGNYVGYTKP